METINEIFNAKSTKNQFNKLIEQARYLEKLNLLFSKLIDSEFASHCFIGKYDDNEMVLVVDSSVWATKLRYRAPDLIKDLQCQSEFKKVTKINFCISPKIADFKAEKLFKANVSKENEKLWRETLTYLKNKK